MIIIVTGAPGSGKSKTCKHLLELTENSAWIDGDSLLATNPFNRSEQRLIRYKNIAFLVKNYYEGGFKTIYISFVYARQGDLETQINLFEDMDKMKVFALIPNNKSLSKHHLGDAYNRVDIKSSVELNNKIALLDNLEIIDNSNLSIDDVSNYILKTIFQ